MMRHIVYMLFSISVIVVLVIQHSFINDITLKTSVKLAVIFKGKLPWDMDFKNLCFIYRVILGHIWPFTG